MSPRSPATTLSPPLTLSPGQSLWLCLPPGSTLRTVCGAVTVSRAPRACGHAVYTPSPTLLKAGEPLACSGTAQATWIQVHNPARATAEVQLEEPTHAPAFWPTAWQALLVAMRRGGKSGRDPLYSCGAGQAAR
jgi:hypothetical protein